MADAQDPKLHARIEELKASVLLAKERMWCTPDGKAWAVRSARHDCGSSAGMDSTNAYVVLYVPEFLANVCEHRRADEQDELGGWDMLALKLCPHFPDDPSIYGAGEKGYVLTGLVEDCTGVSTSRYRCVWLPGDWVADTEQGGDESIAWADIDGGLRWTLVREEVEFRSEQ
jgi:hypothetical protein